MKKLNKTIISIALIILLVSPAYAEKKTICYITTTPMEKSNNTKNIINSLKELENEKTEVYTITATNEEDLKRAYIKATIKNTNYIIINNRDFNEYAKKLARENEDINFIIMDGKETKETAEQKNIYTIKYKTSNASYIAGYTSVYLTQTNHIAILIGKDENKKEKEIIESYTKGAKKATTKLHKAVKIKTYTVNNLMNDKISAKIAEQIYTKGIDIIYYTVQNGENGIKAKAKEYNKKVINITHKEKTEEKNLDHTELATIIRNDTKIIKRVITEIMNKTHEENRNILVKFKKNEYEFKLNENLIDAFTVDAIKAVKKEI
ncbi:MAG: BMP family ABC transporter substrate-binding protein [Synergistaceae bacterium]